MASPYGLAGPYKLSHSGARGDGRRVGYFSKVSEKRTEHLRHAVREGLWPEDRRPGAPDPASYVPRHPPAPHGFLPEVTFSDHRRHFALKGWGLAWLMGICAVTCAAICGSVQVGKLKVYRLVVRHRRLHYASGTPPTTLGALQLQSGRFMLTGIPLVMGEHPTPHIAKAEASLANTERALYHLCPAYVLVLHIVLAHVVSALDYVYYAMPPCPTRLRHTQRAVNKVLTRALRVPRHVPRALLYMPVASGGFDFPHLYSPMRLRHVQGYLRAMDSRSVLVREKVRALSHPDHLTGLDGGDQERLFHTMAETHLEVCVLPAATAGVPAVPFWRFPPGSGWRDGVHADDDTLGWGPLVADAQEVPATAACGVRTWAASPCAAEWASNLETVPTEGLRFAAWVRMAPSPHTSARTEFHCA